MRLGPPWFLRVTAYGLVVNSLLDVRFHWLFLLGLPLGLGWVFVGERTRTVVDDGGITLRGWRGTRHLPWADVRAVRPGKGVVVAVTPGGEEVPLPWVVWRAPVPSDPAYVYEKSGQAVVEIGRAAGYDVALETERTNAQ